MFDADTVVTGLTTQGHGGGGGTVAAQWVTSFKLEYSTDGVTYTDIQTAGSDVVKASVLITHSAFSFLVFIYEPFSTVSDRISDQYGNLIFF